MPDKTRAQRLTDKKDTGNAEVNAPAERPEGDSGEADDLGTVSIHNNVITTIVREKTLQVPGVVGLAATFSDGFVGILGRKSDERGISIAVDDDTVRISLHVDLEFGARIPKVAWQLQHDITEAVEQMTGKQVKAVNVIVQSVMKPGKQEDRPDTGGAI